MSGRLFWQDVGLALATASLVPHRWRPALLRRSGAAVGKNVLLYGGSTFHGKLKLIIEEDVFVNQGCHFDTQSVVRLMRGARIGDHVRFITSSHEIGPASRRAGAGTSAPIDIEEGAWVCSGATILPGVRVARGCIVAAGAVVTRSTEPDGVYAGVPAVRIRDLEPSGMGGS